MALRWMAFAMREPGLVFVLHGAWNSLEMQWMMSCRIYGLPLRWTGLHEVRCLVISTMRYAGICFLRQHGRGHRQ